VNRGDLIACALVTAVALTWLARTVVHTQIE
jgi:hypothetical protein